MTDEPFGGFFQTQRYVYEWDRDGTEVREPVRLQKVRALITRPGSGQALAGGALIVRGVAWSGAAPIERVEVSLNHGPWQKTRLVGVPAAHGWQQWEFLASGLSPGEASIRARATDLVGQVQPERPEWNRRGYGANFIHEVRGAAALTPPGPPGRRAGEPAARVSSMSGSVASSGSGARCLASGASGMAIRNVAPRPGDGLDPDRAAVRGHQRGHDGQAQAGPARPSSSWPGRRGRTARRRARPAPG